MRVAFFVDNEPGQVGGGDFAVFKFAEALAKRGHEALVFAKSRPHRRFQTPGLRIVARPHVARTFRGSGLFDSVFEGAFLRFTVLPLLRFKRPDIVCGALHRAAIEAVAAGKSLGVPIANFYYETPPWLAKLTPDEWRAVSTQRRYRRYRKLWERARDAYLASDCLIGNSALARQYCEEWIGKATAGVVYPGIDLEDVGIPGPWPRPFQVVYIGRLHRHKNLEVVFKALAQIKAPPLLVLAGGGPDRASLERLAKDTRIPVRFAGVVSESEKFHLLKESQLLVFPSTVEGFGMPPMEALACGTPALCSNLPVLQSVYGQYASYAPPTDADAWALMLRTLLADTDRLADAGRRGRSFVEQTFSWERGAAQLEKLFSTAIRQHGGPK